MGWLQGTEKVRVWPALCVSRSVVSTLCHPVAYSPWDSSIHAFSRQESWSGFPFSSPGHLPNSGIGPGSPASEADSLPLSYQGSPYIYAYVYIHTHWRRKWQPAPVFLPGESHGQRSLVGCSPWGRRESDTTEWVSTYIDIYIKCSGICCF